MGKQHHKTISHFLQKSIAQKTEMVHSPHMRINLTQHQSSPEQGCTDLAGEAKQRLTALLTFNSAPTRAELRQRADAVAALAVEAGATSAMIGGAPFFMASLEEALVIAGVAPLYAFSVRESADQPQPDGSVRKVAVFRHVGFVAGSTLPDGGAQ